MLALEIIRFLNQPSNCDLTDGDITTLERDCKLMLDTQPRLDKHDMLRSILAFHLRVLQKVGQAWHEFYTIQISKLTQQSK